MDLSFWYSKSNNPFILSHCCKDVAGNWLLGLKCKHGLLDKHGRQTKAFISTVSSNRNMINMERRKQQMRDVERILDVGDYIEKLSCPVLPDNSSSLWRSWTKQNMVQGDLARLRTGRRHIQKTDDWVKVCIWNEEHLSPSLLLSITISRSQINCS